MITQIFIIAHIFAHLVEAHGYLFNDSCIDFSINHSLILSNIPEIYKNADPARVNLSGQLYVTPWFRSNKLICEALYTKLFYKILQGQKNYENDPNITAVIIY